MLIREIERVIRERGWSQAEAAKQLGVTQPRVSELMRGKVDLFSIDKLVTMLAAAGQRVEVRTRGMWLPGGYQTAAPKDDVAASS